MSRKYETKQEKSEEPSEHVGDRLQGRLYQVFLTSIHARLW